VKRFFLSLVLLATAALPATAAAQSAPAGCQFVLGFQDLQAMDPADIGTCTDNQSNAANGDAVQHTTNGLMAWRKADNWTAFTNGYMTWINGPDGLVSRLNADRFPWEGPDAPAAAPSAAPAAAAPPAALASAPPATPASGPPAAVDLAGGDLPNIGGQWRLTNNQALFNVSQNYDSIQITSQNVRQCTGNGVVDVPAAQAANAQNDHSMQSTILYGSLSGFTVSGNWYSCNTTTRAWGYYPIQLTVSPDLLHLTGQLQETLTFDRVSAAG
jgi:hypothetical protein